MFKMVLKRILTYIFYLCFSFGIGYLSLIGSADYVGEISKSIIPILMTLLALYAAISGQLISRLVSMEFEKVKIELVIDSMERNVKIEAALLFFSFVFFASFSWVLGLVNGEESFTFILKLFKNALVCFDLMYFVYVVYDSSIGLYHLLK